MSTPAIMFFWKSTSLFLLFCYMWNCMKNENSMFKNSVSSQLKKRKLSCITLEEQMLDVLHCFKPEELEMFLKGHLEILNLKHLEYFQENAINIFSEKQMQKINKRVNEKISEIVNAGLNGIRRQFNSQSVLFLNYETEMQREWLDYMPVQERIKLANFSEIRFENYASQVIKFLALAYSNTEIENFVIMCSQEKHVEWTENEEKIPINNVKVVTLQNFGSKVIKVLDLEHKNTQIETLWVICSEEKHVQWTNKQEKTKLINVDLIEFKDFGSQVITVLDLACEKTNIEKLLIYCFKPEHVKWINKQKEKTPIGKVKEIELENYASQIIEVLDLAHENTKVENLFVYCSEKENVEWIKKNQKRISIRGVSEIELQDYASQIRKVLELSESTALVLSKTQ